MSSNDEYPHNAQMHWQSQWHTVSVYIHSATQPAILRESEISNFKSQIDCAVSGLRRAGQQKYLPLGLLTRAWLQNPVGGATGVRYTRGRQNESGLIDLRPDPFLTSPDWF